MTDDESSLCSLKGGRCGGLWCGSGLRTDVGPVITHLSSYWTVGPSGERVVYNKPIYNTPDIIYTRYKLCRHRVAQGAIKQIKGAFQKEQNVCSRSGEGWPHIRSVWYGWSKVWK